MGRTDKRKSNAAHLKMSLFHPSSLLGPFPFPFTVPSLVNDLLSLSTVMHYIGICFLSSYLTTLSTAHPRPVLVSLSRLLLFPTAITTTTTTTTSMALYSISPPFVPSQLFKTRSYCVFRTVPPCMAVRTLRRKPSRFSRRSSATSWIKGSSYVVWMNMCCFVLACWR